MMGEPNDKKLKVDWNRNLYKRVFKTQRKRVVYKDDDENKISARKSLLRST